MIGTLSCKSVQVYVYIGIFKKFKSISLYRGMGLCVKCCNNNNNEINEKTKIDNNEWALYGKSQSLCCFIVNAHFIIS
jgi:hypothetical protein